MVRGISMSLERLCKDVTKPEDLCYSNNKDGYNSFEYFPVTHGSGRYLSKMKASTKVCKEEAVTHTLSPGLFLIHCPHGVCLGFSSMRTHEGPSLFLDLLCRRFREALPRATIVYDNSCNAHHYCLAQEPCSHEPDSLLIGSTLMKTIRRAALGIVWINTPTLHTSTHRWRSS
ncbi:hypothetical protein BaRGS_00009717 [Batillaria attramentaria]|uniref:Uncharacterized protein n=1 Tax=Batillaria attramentaria TaxID=370345 RepID=A0ABD0LII0_9CAEN